MNQKGKIINFNGCSGMLLDENNNKYLVNENSFLYDNPCIGDNVIFNVELYKTIEVEFNIATFVRKIEDKEIQ